MIQFVVDLSTGLRNATRFQKDPNQSYNELIQSLRGIFGIEKVVQVSECPIDIQFTQVEQGSLLLEYLRRECPERSLAEEVALLITQGGTQVASPHGEMFRQTWN